MFGILRIKTKEKADKEKQRKEADDARRRNLKNIFFKKRSLPPLK
jgi:hypothetical protein